MFNHKHYKQTLKEKPSLRSNCNRQQRSDHFKIHATRLFIAGIQTRYHDRQSSRDSFDQPSFKKNRTEPKPIEGVSKLGQAQENQRKKRPGDETQRRPSRTASQKVMLCCHSGASVHCLLLSRPSKILKFSLRS